MSLFLLKPHVVGPEGNITSPDVVVDRLFVNGAVVPVSLLTHEAWQQVAPGEISRAAYGIMALGGGALILPAVVLGSGLVVASRRAWRLNNLDGHVERVTLNGVPLSDVAMPSTEIEALGGAGDALPRGYLLIRTGGEAQDAVLSDPERGRALEHRVVLGSVEVDRWGHERPRPRYSIGPTQKEIPHFI